MNDDKCQFCNGTGKEEGADGCVWCWSTGKQSAQSLDAAGAAQPCHAQPEVLFLKSGYLFHADGKPALTDEGVGYVRADQIAHATPAKVDRLRKPAKVGGVRFGVGCKV